MIRDRVCEAVDLRMQFGRDRLRTQAFERIHQRMGKTVKAVSVLHDAFALYVVKHFTHLLRRERVVIEKRNEASDGTLEINIVFPEGIVCIDEESLAGQGS